MPEQLAWRQLLPLHVTSSLILPDATLTLLQYGRASPHCDRAPYTQHILPLSRRNTAVAVRVTYLDYPLTIYSGTYLLANPTPVVRPDSRCCGSSQFPTLVFMPPHTLLPIRGFWLALWTWFLHVLRMTTHGQYGCAVTLRFYAYGFTPPLWFLLYRSLPIRNYHQFLFWFTRHTVGWTVSVAYTAPTAPATSHIQNDRRYAVDWFNTLPRFYNTTACLPFTNALDARLDSCQVQVPCPAPLP